jgi:predicted unusual protein kinase regulating ubiquinone biosynthesis (AarF/ABC1/UbiB family)
MRPLLCSLATTPALVSPAEEQDWDAFWGRQVRGKLSNAQRVAEGLPLLGPTFVKLGQALATRPDILHVDLADALANLQDNMRPFDNVTAKRIIRRDLRAAMRDSKVESKHLRKEADLNAFMNSLSDEPVAAASIAQVYRGHLPGYGDVAVKVQRPGIRKKVESDATLFHSTAAWIESLRWPSGTPMAGEPLVGSTQLVRTVDEFTARVFEDMDFEREAANHATFEDMYGHKRGRSPTVKVVVPQLFPELCSSRVLVMEWIEGTKLTDIDCVATPADRETEVKENLLVVKRAIECTLSQFLETSLVHADPHTGNLLKVRDPDTGEIELGYLDFGLVNSVPQKVREGIVCAVVQLVFARNVDAVADLCVDMELLPASTLRDPVQRKKFIDALKQTFDDILLWPKDTRGRSTAVPKVRFERLLASFGRLVASFEFTIPPYFLNNARALATLEGIALKLDPEFNILRVIYPYAINQLMCDPLVSRKTEETFLEICRSTETKLVDWDQTAKLLNDWALLTGYRKRRIFWDLATSEGGRRVSRIIVKDWYIQRYRNAKAWYHRRSRSIQSWYRRLFRVATRATNAAVATS